MTYAAKTESSKVSSFIVTANLNIALSTSLTSIPWASYVTDIDPYGDGLTVSSSDITLPAGQYYIRAQANLVGTAANYSYTYGIYEAGTTLIGYEGVIWNYQAAAGSPQKDRTARAYLDITSSTIIQIKGQLSSGTGTLNSTSYASDVRQKARVIIWRLA